MASVQPLDLFIEHLRRLGMTEEAVRQSFGYYLEDPGKRVQEELERFRRLIPVDCDDATLILKGHLLVEEGLQTVLDAYAQVPEALDKFRFLQKLQIARAITPRVEHPDAPSGDSVLFPGDLVCVITKLNKVRNELAHNAEPEDLPRSMTTFVEQADKWCWPAWIRSHSGRLAYGPAVIQARLTALAPPREGWNQMTTIDPPA